MRLGPKLGAGRTADLFADDDDADPGRVVKLFFEGVDPETVDREAANARVVREAGVPSPAVHSIVEVDGRRGIVFDRVDGPTMAARLLGRPWRVVGLARRFADGHAAMHERPGGGLPDLRDRLRRRIRDADLPPGVGDRALSRLADLPDGDAVCHGDFHPENVLLSGDGPAVVDWLDAAAGHPAADAARTDLLLRLADPADGRLRSPAVRGLLRAFRRTYRRRYHRRADVTPEQVRGWLLPVAAARVAEGVPGERRRLLSLCGRR